MFSGEVSRHAFCFGLPLLLGVLPFVGVGSSLWKEVVGERLLPVAGSEVEVEA